MLKIGDRVVIRGSAEEQIYKDCVFVVDSNPYVICGTEVVKMECKETSKRFGGGYATEYLQKA